MVKKHADPFWLWPLYFFSVAAFLLPSVIIPPVWGSSEAREAEVIQSILKGPDFLFPLRHGVVPSKPPLFHWLSSLVCDFASLDPLIGARSVSLLMSIGTLGLCLFLTRHLRSLSDPLYDSPLFSYLTLLILSSTHLFLSMATDARVDATFTFFLTASFCASLWGTSKNEVAESLATSKVWFISAGILSGMAMLTKGPAGLIIPPLFWGLFISKRLNRSLIPECLKLVFLWIVVGLIVASPWYILGFSQAGEAFIGRHFVFENLDRIVGGSRITKEAWWYYVPSSIRVFFPWSLFLIGSALWLLKSFRESKSLNLLFSEPWISGLVRIIAVYFIIISCASGKRTSYLLPITPFVSLLSSSLLLEYSKRFTSYQRRHLATCLYGTIIYLLLGTTIIFATVIECLRLHIFARIPSLMTEWVISYSPHLIFLALASGLFTASFFFLRVRLPLSLLTLFVSLAIIAGFSVAHGTGLGLKGAQKNYYEYARWLRTHLPDGATPSVVKETWDESFDTTLYLFSRPYIFVSPGSATPKPFLLFHKDDAITFADSHHECRVTSTFENEPAARLITKPLSMSLVTCDFPPTV